MAWVGTVSSQMDWERLPVTPLYMLTSELTVHMLKNPAKGADHSTLEGGEGGGWFCKNISCKRLSEGKNCMQHKRNRKLMGKKREKRYPAHHIARKKKFLMTRNHPIELFYIGMPVVRTNGRSLDVRSRDYFLSYGASPTRGAKRGAPLYWTVLCRLAVVLVIIYVISLHMSSWETPSKKKKKKKINNNNKN